jgi:alginate O-acetyltransferase complex protein AlgI
MFFNSIDFLIFFILFLPVYFSVPHKGKWLVLLTASYFFYGYWNPGYLLFLVIPTVFVYAAARGIDTAGKKLQKRLFLLLGLLSGLTLLVVFKYSDFVGSSLHFLLGIFKKNVSHYNPLNLILPIGISFYSFKLASYIIDVYNEKLKPEKHFGHFSLYASFFPQILAGPIDRAVNLIPELKKKICFDYQRVTSGLKLVLWGFFKKIVIADHLAVTVNRVYNNVNSYEGLPLLAAAFFYSIQIYCDFSGYSDIAIGIARILGFKSMDNFDSPYFSKDIKQFWNKWHISLSTWLRDYLFLPIAYATMRKIPASTLVKVKVETWGYIVGMFITMFLGGLWHGASWTFVLWGVIHGLYLIASHTTKKIRKKIVKNIKLNKAPRLHRWIKIFITFNMVSLAWIFFRAKTIPDAFYVVSHLFTNIGKQLASANVLDVVKHTLQLNEVDLSIILLSILLLCIVDFIEIKRDIIETIARKPLLLRWTLYCTVIFFILWFGEFKQVKFIYFQF